MSEKPETVKAKTVRVRIAVAVTRHGDYWYANGASDTPEDARMDAARRMAKAYSSRGKRIKSVWVEADVPLPVEQTVEGKVVERSNP